MVKMGRTATLGSCVGLLLGASLLGITSTASALSTSDKPAAILIWPKIVVNTTAGEDTTVQITNTDPVNLVQAHCFYVNANSHCAGGVSDGAVCQTARDCPLGGTSGGFAACEPGWSETDFDIFLTRGQPLDWEASSGLGGQNSESLPISASGAVGHCKNSGFPCTLANGPLICNLGAGDACVGPDNNTPPQSNAGTGIPPTPEDPFIGSLTCIEFVPGASPTPDTTAPGDLVGQATIESSDSSAGQPLVTAYNAVGLQAIGPVTDNANTQLSIGGVAPTAEYAACPAVLVLNHLFDNSPISEHTDLTLVPCGNNFLAQIPGNVTAQFLVFNEFEQRFSTSRQVPCFFDSQLSLIDTTNPSRSIFSFGFIGTLAGQTRIRGVGSAQTGRGLVGVAVSFTDAPPGAAGRELHEIGDPNFAGTGGQAPVQPDIITIP